jgi:hypothetical protein
MGVYILDIERRKRGVCVDRWERRIYDVLFK